MTTVLVKADGDAVYREIDINDLLRKQFTCPTIAVQTLGANTSWNVFHLDACEDGIYEMNGEEWEWLKRVATDA